MLQRIPPEFHLQGEFGSPADGKTQKTGASAWVLYSKTKITSKSGIDPSGCLNPLGKF